MDAVSKPGVRFINPLEVGTYDQVKSQVLGHYRSRKRAGVCQYCKHKGRNTWFMARGRWKVRCSKCRKEFSAHSLDLSNTAEENGTFGKWIFPVIKRIVPETIMDALVAVQPMPPYNQAEAEVYALDHYRITGTRTGRVRMDNAQANIQEMARNRQRHEHPTPEEEFCPICKLAAELAAKSDADARAILLRAYEQAKAMVLDRLTSPMQCDRCGSEVGVKLEPSRRLDECLSVPLCPGCAEEYHDYWDSLWADYNRNR